MMRSEKHSTARSEDAVDYLPERDESGDAVIARALEILESRLRKPGEAISKPEDVEAYLSLHLAEREREYFAVLFLDNRHRVIAFEEMFSGTIDSTSVYPREVAKRALEVNAAAVIVAHNHPSGTPEPSEADRRITVRLRDALGLLDIRVLDHVVVGHGACVSFATRGMI